MRWEAGLSRTSSLSGEDFLPGKMRTRRGRSYVTRIACNECRKGRAKVGLSHGPRTLGCPANTANSAMDRSHARDARRGMGWSVNMQLQNAFGRTT